MSERKTKRLGEENSALIHQLLNELRAFSAIGTDNAQWLSVTHGFTNQTTWVFDSGGINFIRNTSATDFTFLVTIPKETNKGSYKLYIKDIRIGLDDADANDYINSLSIVGHTAFDTASYIYTWAGNANSAKEWLLSSDDGAWAGPYDCSTLKTAYLWIAIVATTAYEFEATYINVQYYYDT